MQAPSRARKVVRTGDVIVATTRPYLRNTALIPADLDNQICSTGFCVLRPLQELFLAEYIYYASRSHFFISQLVQEQEKAVYPSVTDREVYAAQISVPYVEDRGLSLRVQRAIVSRIKSLFDELREIQNLQTTIGHDVDEVMDSVLNDVFDTRTTGTWNSEDLGQLVEIIAQLVDPQSHQYKDLHIFMVV